MFPRFIDLIIYDSLWVAMRSLFSPNFLEAKALYQNMAKIYKWGGTNLITMANLDALVNKVPTRKIGKYVGYSLEAGGVCGVVYGIFTGDNYTTACGGFVAYLGTTIHRGFKYLPSRNTGKTIENREKSEIGK